MLFRAMTGLVTVYHGTALAAGLRIKLGNQVWLCINHDLSIAAEDLLATKTGKPQSGLEHWFPHLKKFIDQGVDGFKLDPFARLTNILNVNTTTGTPTRKCTT